MSNFCTHCGVQNPDEAKFCKSCGKELSEAVSKNSDNFVNNRSNYVIARTSGKAIASLILSVLWLYGIGSIIAIILGHMARSDIKKSDGKLTGNGLALAGLIISYSLIVVVFLGILAAIVIPKLAAIH